MSSSLSDLVREQNNECKFRSVCKQILQCTACGARWEASKPVPPVGPVEVHIMVVGRNPGTQEDISGRPFHPEAPGGSELHWYLQVANIVSEFVFITNTVNCHTWQDREPTEEEITICSKLHLDPIIYFFKPTIIIACGRIAVQHLTDQTESLMRYHSVPRKTRFGVVWPIPHPAVVCYDSSKRIIMERSAVELRGLLYAYETRYGVGSLGKAFKR